MNEMMGTFIMLLLIGLLIVHILRNRSSAEPEEEQGTDFDFLSVHEQIAAAHETADAIGDMEQLLTDLASSSEDDVIVLHLEWVGRDARSHAFELYCNGADTASDCMTDIAEREAHDLRKELSYQCAVLSGGGRHRKNCRKNDARMRGEGQDAADEIMSAMRRSHQHG